MPEGTLTKQLTALLATAETLNNASNSINTILLAVEEQLMKANIGLEVWLPCPPYPLSRSTPKPIDGGDGICYWRVELGFAKVGDAWHFAARDFFVKEGSHDREGTPAWTNESLDRDPYPLAQASRQERIEALRLLPELIARLQEEAEKAIQNIEEAKKLIIC